MEAKNYKKKQIWVLSWYLSPSCFVENIVNTIVFQPAGQVTH